MIFGVIGVFIMAFDDIRAFIMKGDPKLYGTLAGCNLLASCFNCSRFLVFSSARAMISSSLELKSSFFGSFLSLNQANIFSMVWGKKY